MPRIVNDEALDTLFRTARDHRAWLSRPVSDTMLRALWELLRLAPTVGAAGPARIVFAKSEIARTRLLPAIAAERRAGVDSAPVTAILGGREADIGPAAIRENMLLAGYLILAARALGLDCGPIWEFDAALVDAAFFPGDDTTATFLCALGHGDDARVLPIEPRPGFAEACRIL